MPKNQQNTDSGFFSRTYSKVVSWWDYFNRGVWREPQSNWRVNTVKTLSLSVQSFLNTDLQSRACAMAFRTMLALVPALALLFAIGRGFGFQAILEDELYGLFPGQRDAIAQSLKYVDSYLNTASEGVFVGVGLVFLLWTLISLISNVEGEFNAIWGIKTGRSIWSQITDYTAMLLILPVLMICASGLTLFLSSALQAVFHFSFMTPLITWVLKVVSWMFMWLFFAAAYALIPNTKVKFSNAMIAGIFAGSGFMILQWLFVTGQIYVTRYNAIYGSFAFFPLLLLWLQLTWIVCLCGAVLCYSSQNIFQFSFSAEIDSISPDYRRRVMVAITAIIVQCFVKQKPLPTRQSISRTYGIPIRLVGEIIDQLLAAGVVIRVVVDASNEVYGYAPAVDPEEITLGFLFAKICQQGRNNFIPGFDKAFTGVDSAINALDTSVSGQADTILLKDMKINIK
ncbi:MAG: YihY/virulence factor BrkB family protein [Muribaculaceae bacterium]|nr:YihY/virulence factor BrkB family protein [Muribaculaceae bacterium]